MIVRKNKTTTLLKIACPKCGSEDTSYWKFNKSEAITNKSKIRCNKCYEVHRLDECKLTEVTKHE